MKHAVLSLLSMMAIVSISTVLYAEQTKPAKADSVAMNPVDTVRWTFSTAVQQLTHPNDDTIPALSAALWMIKFLEHPDTTLPDSMTAHSYRLMSYSTLAQFAKPFILPLLIDGLNSPKKGVRNSSLSGIFTLVKSRYAPAEAVLDSLTLNAKNDDIRRQSRFFKQRIIRARRLEVQH